MSNVLIVSNRLPLQIKITDDGLDVSPSVGGLATGLRSVHEQAGSRWIGWAGLAEEDIPAEQRSAMEEVLASEQCVAVPMSEMEIEQVYYGFSNETLWPLFHYFSEYVSFLPDNWEAYRQVNKRFAEAVVKEAKPGDTIWVHDYQLLLVPAMVRELMPELAIGFFLHIPFPSFEVFRTLPWRSELLEGMLGADLIGFHTHNYTRHFLSSVRRILGYEVQFHRVHLPRRIAHADSFPMGIDYKRFHEEAVAHSERSRSERSQIRRSLDKFLAESDEVRLVLSIDRLDYTKGIANRLRAFERFLNKYPDYIGRVSLIMLAVPSRAAVEQYQILKSEVDELVGSINGSFATIDWQPVHYFYRSLPFEDLVDLYTACDIALLTPIRDGMNLVAKEYIASRTNRRGVLILSEMAGASHEMSEALLINPNDSEDIADALQTALTMPENEQIERNFIMQDRLERYNIDFWSQDFLTSLSRMHEEQKRFLSRKLSVADRSAMAEAKAQAKQRIFFLDYDGTLVGFRSQPEKASPDEALYALLDQLASDERNRVVLISGRDKETFDAWFGDKPYTLVCEHGVWSKIPGEEWIKVEGLETEWKEVVRPTLELYTDRTPGSFVEEKNFSLAWHYRKADHELGSLRANELKDQLRFSLANHDLEILDGNMVVEVKNAGVNKGRAAVRVLAEREEPFIVAIGDDWTDETLFEALPERAYTIKVGMKNSFAKANLESPQEVRELLTTLAGMAVVDQA